MKLFQSILVEVQTHDAELEEYDRDTNTLLETLEPMEASELSANSFQIFFREWEELKGTVSLQIARYLE